MTQEFVSICPICGKDTLVDSVRALEIHVNECLDQSSQDNQDESSHSSSDLGAATLRADDSFSKNIPDGDRDAKQKADATLSSSDVAEPEQKRMRVTSHNEPVRSGRTCPFYKWIPQSSWTVDAFKFGAIPNCAAYFLRYISYTRQSRRITLMQHERMHCSHFHSDHYDGLTKSFVHGSIYCSEITAKLVIQQLRVDPQYVKALPLNERVQIQDGFVTLIDANQYGFISIDGVMGLTFMRFTWTTLSSCPGAVLFLFEIAQTVGKDITWKRHLHTGDFRANPAMIRHASLSCFAINDAANSMFLDSVFLDTTYCHPSHVFPDQSDVIQMVCDLVQDICENNHSVQVAISGNPLAKYFQPISKDVSDSSTDSTRSSSLWPIFSAAKKNKKPYLVLVGSYSIGKEKIFFAIAERLKSKIYVSSHRKRMLSCCFDASYLSKILTNDPHEAQVHVVPMGDLEEKKVQDKWLDYKSSFSRLIAVRPTGWTFTQRKGSKSKVMDSNLSPRNTDAQQVNYFTNVPRPPVFSRSQLTPKALSKEITLLPVPYSEHSSVLELEGFLKSLNVNQVIPTVNVGNPKSRDQMMSLIRQWTLR